MLLISGVLLSLMSIQRASPVLRTPVASMTAFVDVAVIPMDRERVIPHQTVLVQGDTVAALGPVDAVRVPPAARRVAGRGFYLLPGLGDMHMHAFPAENADGVTEPALEAQLACYVAHGVTTVRLIDRSTEAAETPTAPLGDPVIPAVRARLVRREMPGPRLYLAAKLPTIDEPEALARRLEALRAVGYTFLDLEVRRWLDRRQLDTAMAAARRTGLRVSGGVPPGLGLSGALGGPFAAIEHLQGYWDTLARFSPDERRQTLTILEWDSLLRTDTTVVPRGAAAQLPALAAATARAGVWNVPLVYAAQHLLTLWAGADTAAVSGSPLLAWQRQLVLALRQAGAGLLLGTDAPAWGVACGSGVAQELERLVAIGLTPYEALVTSTRNVAAFLGEQAASGTIAVGKRADLVLLEGNPLEDIRRTQAVAGVMLGGRWLPRAELDRRLLPLEHTLHAPPHR